MRRLRGAAARVTVGVHQEEGAAAHGDGPATVADVGCYNELGLGVPQRSFVASTVDEKEDLYRAELREAADDVVMGRTANASSSLVPLGRRAQEDIQATIRGGVDPPDEAATVEQKGSSTTLMDSEQLYGAIQYKVKSK